MAKNYVENDDLRLELALSHQKGELTPRAIEMLMLMIERIQLKYKYVNLQDKEDCYSHALERVLLVWKQCDVSKPRPFAWFTRVIANGLHAGWNKLAKGRTEFSTSNIFDESV